MEKEELNFENETRKHQKLVSDNLICIAIKILERAKIHDSSKLLEPERSVFIKTTENLKGLTYGSEEYKKQLLDMKVALDHHYANNKHHPEYNDINGYSSQTLNDPIRSMDLIDIIEMFCDWEAATKRHDDGDIYKSIDINEKRFGISEQISAIYRNSTTYLKEKKTWKKHYSKG